MSEKTVEKVDSEKTKGKEQVEKLLKSGFRTKKKLKTLLYRR